MDTENTVIIKIGTRVLTTDEGMIDKEIVENIVAQIAKLYHQGLKVVVVTSGAAACGRGILCFREKDPIIMKQMLTALGQARLMKIYGRLFRKYGIPVAQALLERNNFSNRKRYLNLRHTLEGLINHRIIPIVNENDVVATRGLRFGDNDELACLTAIALKASKFIICSDVDGLYTNDPRKDEKAELIREVNNITTRIQKMASTSTSGVGLGGMLSKLKVAKLATHWGIETWVMHGKRENGILEIFEGKGYGTRFTAEPNPATDFQRWLSAGAIPEGVIEIDTGAANAIRERKSLLFVGIVQSKGEFKEGDIVDIYTQDGRIAMGISHYDSTEVQKILKKTKEERRNLRELIHTDNIVLIP